MTVFGFINPFKDLDVSLEVLKEVKEEVKDVYQYANIYVCIWAWIRGMASTSFALTNRL